MLPIFHRSHSTPSRHRARLPIAPCLAGFLASVWWTLPAHAAVIQVTSTVDIVAADGSCSLREAIEAANSDAAQDTCAAGSGTDTIQVPAGTYSLALAGFREDGNLTGDYDLTSSMLIEGDPAGGTTIDGQSIDRVFHIAAGAVVELRHLTITGGKSPDYMAPDPLAAGDDGGGILNEGDLTIRDSVIALNTTGEGAGDNNGGFSGGHGGGIASFGTLTMRNSQLLDNTTGDGGHGYTLPGSGGSGAGLFSIGVATIEDSLIQGNQCGDHGFFVIFDDFIIPGGGQGGGIFSQGTLTMRRTAVRDNRQGTGGVAGRAGGVYATGSNNLISDSLIADNPGAYGYEVDGHAGAVYLAAGRMVNTTVTGNGFSGDAENNVYAFSGTVIEYSTIVANARGGLGGNHSLRNNIILGNVVDCTSASLTSTGYNLVGQGTGCPATAPGDIVLDPALLFSTVLTPLADNGGPTETHAVVPGGPAEDAGTCTRQSGAQILDDQRGQARPSGATCDIGAYEHQVNPSATMIAIDAEPPGANCVDGGQRIDIGIDNDGDGFLDPGEITATTYVCYDVDDPQSLLASTPLPVGDGNCPAGGYRLDTGLDNGDGGGSADDGILDPGEIDETAYLCAGEAGANSLITTTDLPIGDTSCPAGGYRIEIGLDNGDGNGTANDDVLQPGEIDSVSNLCRGADAVRPLVTTTVEPAGANCENGGVRLDLGTDDDFDGILDPEEVVEVSYICNGSDGAAALVAITPVAAGSAECSHGGQQLQTGIDDNGDGILDAEEVDQTAYVCHGPTSSGCRVSDGRSPGAPVGGLLVLLALCWSRRKPRQAGGKAC